MARKPVDYRNLGFRTLFSRQYRHLLLLPGWAVYMFLFFLSERIPPWRCLRIHCELDGCIPFCEWFLIPYVLWYGLVAFSLVFYLRYDVAQFRYLQIYILVTQAVAMAVFFLLPTRQDLRPAVFPRQNLLSRGVALLYRVDSNTGVCPSMHAAWSMALISAWNRDPHASSRVKGAMFFLSVSVIVSTVFLKQHSVVDVLAAVPLCLLARFIAQRCSP